MRDIDPRLRELLEKIKLAEGKEEITRIIKLIHKLKHEIRANRI